MRNFLVKTLVIGIILASFTSCGSYSPDDISVPEFSGDPIEMPQPIASQSAQPQSIGDGVSFSIIFTNDMHGHIQNDGTSFGYARIAQLKTDMEKEGDVLLFSAGDVLQGTPYVDESNGEEAVNLMNMAGYDALAPGSHDFDWGGDNLEELRLSADFDVLSANILRASDSSMVFTDNKIFTLPGGAKVGVFGVSAPSTRTTVNPVAVENYQFLADNAMYDAASKQVEALESQGCDVIVCLGHLGVEDEHTGNRSYDLIDNVQGIDVFIDGLTHRQMNEDYNGTLLVNTGGLGENVGIVTCENGQLSAELISAVYQDEATARYVAELSEDIDSMIENSVVITEVDLNGEAEDIGTGETNLADLVTDAMLWYANTNMSGTTDAAVINAGAITGSLEEGDITMEDINDLFLYTGTLTSIKVTGEQLLEVIEAGAFAMPEASPTLAQVSGVTYKVTTSNAYAIGEIYPGSTYFSPANAGGRVQVTSVGGEPFSLGAVYTIVTTAFLADGGESYYAFTGARADSVTGSGVLIEDVLIAYITQAMNGVVDYRYEEPGKRILIE